MVNLLNLCERLIQAWLPVTEVENLISIEYLKSFLNRNHMALIERIDNGKENFYRVARKEIPVCFISDENSNFSFLDLSDIHFGHPDFKEDLLRAKLKEALERDVRHIFIAGDIFEGIRQNVTYEEALATEYKQLDMAYKVFKDYDLNYYAINGNHDYTFEFFGLHNPIDLLKNMLRRDGINFNFFDCYIMDFIIAGVAKRVMHLEKYKKPQEGFCITERLNRFTDQELVVYYADKCYPVRFFTCGHIHVNMSLYDEVRNIYISQPGSFVQGDNNCVRGIFVAGETNDENVLVY